MRNNNKIAVIIPAYNEEPSIGKVIGDIPDYVDRIIVVDNGSTDQTPRIAEKNGALVLHESQRGYGAACLKGIAALQNPDIVCFLDGDYSDHPEEMDQLVDPIIEHQKDFVMGSRVTGEREKGALSPQARFGNWLACKLIEMFWGVTYTDLGPFRAIRYSALLDLEMNDKNYGWTIEMQLKAIQKNLVTIEVPVQYRRRTGKSKVSGTVTGIVGAGYKILSTIFIYAFIHFRKRMTAKVRYRSRRDVKR